MHADQVNVMYGFCIIARSHETLICIFIGGVIHFRMVEQVRPTQIHPVLVWHGRRALLRVLVIHNVIYTYPALKQPF